MTNFLFKAMPIALVFAVAVLIYLLREHYAVLPSFAAALTVFLLAAPLFSLGFSSPPELLALQFGQNQRRIMKTIIYFLLTYLFYAFLTKSFNFQSFWKLFLFLTIPAFLMFMSRPHHPLGVWDLLAMLVIWLPFDMGWIKDIWAWPQNKGGYVLNAVMATSYAVILFSGYRRMDGIGFEFRFRYRDIGVFFLHFAIFFVIALVFGRATDFIHYNGSTNFLKLLAASAGIFLVIAIPEELLFRGLLQNFLTQKTGSHMLALVSTSILFGATHLNNTPTPDWRYFVLASVAGFFYGRAFIKTNNLMAPALIHTAVDGVWVTFFM